MNADPHRRHQDTPQEAFRRAWLAEYSSFVGPPTAIAGLWVVYQADWAWQAIVALALYIAFNIGYSYLEVRALPVTRGSHPRAWANGLVMYLMFSAFGDVPGSWLLVLPTVFGSMGSPSRNQARYIQALAMTGFCVGSLQAGVEWVSLLPTTGGLVFAGAVSERLYQPLVDGAVESAARERRLEEANAQLARSLDARKVFLATMSHEIRTPMNGVLGMAELLEETELDAEQRTMLDTLRNSGQGLLGVINDILDMSKLESGHMAIESVPTDPRQLAERTLDLLRHGALRNGVELRLEAVGVPERLALDPVRLRQVLLNLGGNACKFTSSGSIVVRMRWADERLMVDVQDTGIGISPEAIDGLFQPFSQADASTTRRFGGTGLGLAICRRLVGLMGGELTATSRVGLGSTFSFSVDAPRTTDAVVEERRERTGRVPNLRVLLVDDNHVNRMVASAMLDRLGVPHHVVDSGHAALEYMAQSPGIDLVLLDCQMPGMDGFETCRRLRQRGETLPILALTAGVTAEERALCAASGMDAVVAKPVSLASLQAALVAHGREGREVA